MMVGLVAEATASPAQLTAIPEAVGSELRRSKRRAGNSDEVMLDRATKLRAGQDEKIHATTGDKANSSSFLQFLNEFISSSFNGIGINLGVDETSVSSSVLLLKNLEESRINEVRLCDWKTEILDKEERSMLDEQEVDTFILNHLCGGINGGGNGC